MRRTAAVRRALGLCLAISLLHGAVSRAADAERPIELSLDATEAPRKLLHARLTIPVDPGPLTLYYPKWIQGEHQPNGPINDLSGLKIRAGSRPIPWQRDDLDLYGAHVAVDFTERLRPTVRFASVDELVAQMHDDVTAARRLLTG